MRNGPAPTKYLKQGLSPLNYQTMALFYYLKDDHHQFGMDNIYNSAAFFRSAYHHDRKVLCQNMDRKAGIGISKCVLQDEEKNPVSQLVARGTVKAAIL